MGKHPVLGRRARPSLRDRRTHITKDGTHVPVSISAGLIEYGGRRVFQDIVRHETERKQAQEALQRGHAELKRRVEERTAEQRRVN